MNEDAVVACAALVGRTGASEFQIGHNGDDDSTAPVTWWAHAQYRGVRITSEGHPTPSGAANGLAERLLSGGTCRCGRTVTLSDAAPGCRWTLVGPKWTPGCDAAPIKMAAGSRGDLAKLQAAIEKRKRRAARGAS